jgi:chaperone modulatory protein CbpM
MTSPEDLVAAIDELTASDLEAWVSSGSVAPAGRPRKLRFSAADCARVHLICDMRHHLMIDDEAMPIVLSLLDQVYGLRQRLGAMGAAIEAQPEPVRRAIARSLTDTSVKPA